MTRLAVLIASYNRRDHTLQCLAGLTAGLSRIAGLETSIFLVDASSTDGTAESVRSRFPQVSLHTVSSEIYWAEAMLHGYTQSSRWNPDAFLWVNDDITLDDNGLERLFTHYFESPNSIWVGSMRDPRTGNVSYSGRRLGPRWNRLMTREVPQVAPWAAADLANGNVLLASKEVDAALGGFPRGYKHALADFAYSLRARRQDFDVRVIFPPIGSCTPNAPWADGYSGLSWLARLKRAAGPKGTPIRAWARYVFEFGGLAAPLYLVAPYVGALRRFRASS